MTAIPLPPKPTITIPEHVYVALLCEHAAMSRVLAGADMEEAVKAHRDAERVVQRHIKEVREA